MGRDGESEAPETLQPFSTKQMERPRPRQAPDLPKVTQYEQRGGLPAPRGALVSPKPPLGLGRESGVVTQTPLRGTSRKAASALRHGELAGSPPGASTALCSDPPCLLSAEGR